MQFLKEHLEVVVEFFRGIGERAAITQKYTDSEYYEEYIAAVDLMEKALLKIEKPAEKEGRVER